MRRSRAAALAGIGIALLYLAGATLSGRASLFARRPLLDGLAPPSPYRWVDPPPGLAASNKPPASISFKVKLGSAGSELGAFSTSDGQVNLVLSEGAVPASPGQTAVEVSIEPLDPASLQPPPGLVVAGNAYRIQASYRPSGRKVDALGGQSSVGLVYPLLSTPVASPSGHLVLASTDGRSWRRLQSTDTSGTHQVSAALNQTGYVEVGIPPAAKGAGGDSRTRVLLFATAGAAVIVVAALLLRGRLTPAGRGGGRPRAGGGRRGPPRGGGRGGQRPPGGGTPRPGPVRRPPGANPARRRRRR
ncbi:MAG TPA: hypothetical protein VGR68_09625 [Actinomycetota bacterium]|jgi:hypothetical protein|nr:hypothetical protein [Actinomycetota bacterium]